MNNINVQSLAFKGTNKMPKMKYDYRVVDKLGFDVPRNYEINRLKELDPMRAKIILQQDALKIFSKGMKEIFSLNFIKKIFKK